MNAPLQGISVLLVEDDPGARNLLRCVLEERGAIVRIAADIDEGYQALESWRPTVVVSDIATEDASAMIAELRAEEATRTLPAIALIARSLAARDRATLVGIQKCIVKPVNPYDLIAAIASLAFEEHDPTARPIETLVASNNTRALLHTLNRKTSYRFSSIFRFDYDTDRLASVWTFDRENPRTDLFPLDVLITGSYCVFVREQRAPFVVEDAREDARVAGHPKRHELLAYCGVPLLRRDRSIFGSICHFDAQPRPIAEGVVSTLERVAEMLKPSLPPDQHP
jgi:CheY-like chemotaxis protein